LSIDYLDEDVSYLLGLIVARGTISRDSRLLTIVIEFPFRNLQVEGLTKSYTNVDEISRHLDRVVNRLRGLGIDVIKNIQENSCQLVIEDKRQGLFDRILRQFFGDKTSFREFRIPEQVFNAEEIIIKKEFLRGYVDVAGWVRKSNVYTDGRHRVYIDVLNDNWYLPIELCHLLQDHLNIPVQTITWGHPNIRDPWLEEYNQNRKYAWAREHQIKIFAHEFLPIGFYIRHKDEILRELAEYNKQNFSVTTSFCSPPKEVDEKKPKHPCENDYRLPQELRGKHCDAYWQVCEALGCFRLKKQLRLI